MQLKENDIITNTNKYNYNFIDMKEIPYGIKFYNNNIIDLKYLKNIPNNIEFYNSYILLDSLLKLPSGVIFNNTNKIFINKKVDLSELNYKELINLYYKLSEDKSYLNKNDLLPLIREKKLNKILCS